MDVHHTHKSYRAFNRHDLRSMPWLQALSCERREAMEAVAAVLPFRVSSHVVEELIDWTRVPDDPMFQLCFPQPEMLQPEDLARMVTLVRSGASEEELRTAAEPIRQRMNPNPDEQDLNVPRIDGKAAPGIQHKYRPTILFFPPEGQVCHTYCSYCFRWPQFVPMEGARFGGSPLSTLLRYLELNPGVSDVVLTGGDPLVMRAPVLARYLEALLDVDTVRIIRLGSKAPAFWPYRFVTAPDADDVLRLFERVVASGKHLALMLHYSHPRELETPIAREAVSRLRSTGAILRSQAPVLRHVNDAADTWVELWRSQLALGIVPYYLFVERVTGPSHYFALPMARTFEIFTAACRRVSGVARTVRGPCMSASPGKLLVDGIVELGGQRLFVLKVLQGRDPDWGNRIFFAEYDEHATWIDQLRPAFGEDEFFFEPTMRSLRAAPLARPSTGLTPLALQRAG